MKLDNPAVARRCPFAYRRMKTAQLTAVRDRRSLPVDTKSLRLDSLFCRARRRKGILFRRCDNACMQNAKRNDTVRNNRSILPPVRNVSLFNAINRIRMCLLNRTLSAHEFDGRVIQLYFIRKTRHSANRERVREIVRSKKKKENKIK